MEGGGGGQVAAEKSTMKLQGKRAKKRKLVKVKSCIKNGLKCLESASGKIEVLAS